MLSPGTSNSYYQLVFTFLNISRNQEFKHICQLVQKLTASRKTLNVILNRLVITRLRTKLFYIIRIWKESYIEYKIRIIRYSIFEAKRKDRDYKIIIRGILYENTIKFYP